MSYKTTDLTEETSPQYDDVLEIVGDPSGTPASKKIEVGNLRNGVISSEYTGTGDVTLTATDPDIIWWNRYNEPADTITLPDATTCTGKSFTICVGASSLADLACTETGFNGSSDQTLGIAAKSSATVVSNGTYWIVTQTTSPW